MNTFGAWQEHDVEAHNAKVARMKTAKRHRIEAGVGEVEITQQLVSQSAIKQPLDSGYEIKGKVRFGAGEKDQECNPSDSRREARRPQSVQIRPARPSYSSEVVDAFLLGMQVMRPFYEYYFHPKRKWRFDLAWPTKKLALEVQGGTWRKGGGAHRGTGALRDMEKFSEAAALGWRILYCQPKDLCTVATAELIKRALEIKP